MIRPTESDPLPSPSQAIGLAGLKAAAGACPRAVPGVRLPALAYGAGWFAPENDPATSEVFRWMRTRSTIDVGAVAVKRPAVVLRSTISSLTVPRRVTVTVDGTTVQTLQVPPDKALSFAVRIRAGTGIARVALRTNPPATSATQVNPADHRQLAVRVSAPSVARA
jgi:hypothetical protein